MLDLLLIFLAAAGVILVVWCLVGVLLQPVFGRGMVTLCFVRGDGRDLEGRVRIYGWLREGRLSGGRLVLVDCGLTAHGLEVAGLLQDRFGWLERVPRVELEAYLAQFPGQCHVAK